MKTVYISSFISPHVKPFCDRLYKRYGEGFTYVETMQLTEERKKLGYGYTKEETPYVINLSGNIKAQKQLANEADCVIINTGSAHSSVVSQRIADGKLTFFCNERLFKKGIIKYADLRLWRQRRLNIAARGKNVYLLCMGAYVAGDFERIGFEKGKSYKLGYFPEITESEQHISDDKFRIVWTGRMINWKRPEMTVKIAEKLQKAGCTDFEMTVIGGGSMCSKVSALREKSPCRDKIKLVGQRPNSEVRECMAKSDALLITSSKQEGWGAVVNEALGAGTPVVAFDKIGSARFLLKDGVNGRIVRDNSAGEAARALLTVRNNLSMRENAAATLKMWNAALAEERFSETVEKIMSGEESPCLYEEGPMSRAD